MMNESVSYVPAISIVTNWMNSLFGNIYCQTFALKEDKYRTQ